jgi:hypothetical protein
MLSSITFDGAVIEFATVVVESLLTIAFLLLPALTALSTQSSSMRIFRPSPAAENWIASVGVNYFSAQGYGSEVSGAGAMHVNALERFNRHIDR